MRKSEEALCPLVCAQRAPEQVLHPFDDGIVQPRGSAALLVVGPQEVGNATVAVGLKQEEAFARAQASGAKFAESRHQAVSRLHGLVAVRLTVHHKARERVVAVHPRSSGAQAAKSQFEEGGESLRELRTGPLSRPPFCPR